MFRIMRKSLASIALAAGVLLLTETAAMAATVNVSIVDFAFNPATAKPKQGDTVMWTNTGAVAHTVSSYGCSGSPTNGPALFCSPTLNPNQTFSKVINVAGKYKYQCNIHTSMQGTVSAPMKASPPNGGVTTVFTITWATGGVPAGSDVPSRVSPPGGPEFVLWKDNQTAQAARFVPDMGTCVYKFRARLQNYTTGKFSGFSAAKSITVS